MGWNTTIMFLNDSVHTYKDHKDQIIANIESMAHGAAVRDYKTNEIREMRMGDSLPIGNHVNGMSLVHRAHMDDCKVVILGHNGADTLLRHTWLQNIHDEAAHTECLRRIADQMGYRIVKKSIR